MEKIGKDMTLCEECNKIVKYRIEWYDETEEFLDHEVSYRAQRAICPECGEEVVAGAVDDYNLDALYAAYRKITGIITPEEVKAITEKYDIDPESLNSLLGWDDGLVEDIIVKGFLPSDEYSDRLRSLLSNEAAYRILLEDNKDKISPEAYERSRATLRDDMSPEEFVDMAGVFFKATPEELPETRIRFAARYGIGGKMDSEG